MTKSRRAGPRGPVIVTETPQSARPRERLFGGPTPDGPLPGHLLVLLSRLHRAENTQKERRDTARS